MILGSPLTELKGVGEEQARKFAVLGIKTLGGLVEHYPRRYDDYSTVTPIGKLRPGAVTIEAAIKQVKGRRVRRGLHITEAIASDDTGSVRLIWFNQPYRAGAIKSDQRYFVSGQYELGRGRFAIMNPSMEMVSDLPINTARILAVYRSTKGLTSRQIRLAVYQALPLIENIPETLPLWVVKEQQLLSRAEALIAIHMPSSVEKLAAARRRLGFEEVFQLSLASLLNKQENQNEPALRIPFQEELAQEFVRHLPFTLTDTQRRAVWQAYLDLQKPYPMNRLIEGDVGSGKTVVATMVALMAIEQGWQVAFMAPTELLARQHADTIHALLSPLGKEDLVTMLVGALSASQKAKARTAIKSGKAGFVVGTQALIQEKVDMHKLALIIIDEQHRFGVEQRKLLMAKADHMPHVLSLSATPIPRSLALTLYGELDISLLTEKPADRKPIITSIISPNARAGLYGKIDEELAAGRQMFVVCPLISPAEEIMEAETAKARGLPPIMSSAEKAYEELRSKNFKHRRVGLLHGKLKPAEKQAVMERFVRHELDILVATTVIEVGVDVPNATIMLIENAEHFGLAQLHQLRGRVGRSHHQGYCYLLLDDSGAPSRRLRALEQSNDGFSLAELDLSLRGPGAIYGTAQHGSLDLRVAQLTDTELITSARESAQKLLQEDRNLLQYKELMLHVNRLRAVTNLN